MRVKQTRGAHTLARAALLLAGLLSAGAVLAADPILDHIRLPPGFRIERFAQVPNARQMALGRDTLFVGSMRDGRVHADDVLEIMVVPNSARLDYYHFSVNPLGTRYDAELRQGGNVRTTEWDANWQAQTARGPQAWTVEVAIPFVELGLTGLSRGDWAVNVARERQAGTRAVSSGTGSPVPGRTISRITSSSTTMPWRADVS